MSGCLRERSIWGNSLPRGGPARILAEERINGSRSDVAERVSVTAVRWWLREAITNVVGKRVVQARPCRHRRSNIRVLRGPQTPGLLTVADEGTGSTL